MKTGILLLRVLIFNVFYVKTIVKKFLFIHNMNCNKARIQAQFVFRTDDFVVQLGGWI